ncbi:MAG: bile acid:sodium symporter [Gemmatimonadota bacterium]
MFDSRQTIAILLAVLTGLAAGQLSWIADHAIHLVVPALMAMLWSVFLHVPLRRMGAALRNLRFTGWSLGVNFIWTPLFAYGLGWLFLRDHPDLWIGLIMLMVTPCTDWYLVFTGLAGGNVRLSTALLPWHLVLQLLLLPVYLLLFAGTLVRIDYGVLVQGVLLVLVVPLALAWAFRRGAEAVRGRAWVTERALPAVAGAQLAFLTLAIAAMFASQGTVLLDNPIVVLRLLVPLLLFFFTTVLLAIWVSRIMRFAYPDCASLCFATLARNSPVALAIAVVAFPDRPLIALTLVVGPLIELPVLAVVSQALLAMRHRLDPAGGSPAS